MTWGEVVLTIAVSAVTSILVTMRGNLRFLLPIRRPKPLDPKLLEGIYRSAAGVSTTGGQPPGTPPSSPRPPLQ